MDRVIVSISRHGQGDLDVEVPADLTIGALMQELALALGWDVQGGLYAEQIGRMLHPSETFTQAGVFEGTRLFFQSSVNHGSRASKLPPSPPPPSTPSPPSPPPPPSPPSQGQGPVIGWRPLDLGQPVHPSSSQASEASSPPLPSGGFVWKRIDED